jgi:penicillin-binding protein 1A
MLTIEESATLIGMLKANTFYNPRINPVNAFNRRNVVLKQMEKYGYLTASVVDSISNLPLVLNYKKTGPGGPADYFLVRVRNELNRILSDIKSRTGRQWDPENDGLAIKTTLNLALQGYAVSSFQDHLPAMQTRLVMQYQSQSGRRYLDQTVKSEMERLKLSSRAEEMIVQEIFGWSGNRIDTVSVADSLRKALTTLHAGLIAVDPFTGEIKAWVGGIDFKSQPYDQILARRQLASVFKPVLYAAALEEGMEPCHYLDNDSVILSDFKDWSPENYDHTYGGKFSLAGALAQSMNIPTYSLFLELGFEKTDSMWRRMGFSFELDNTPSLAMGTAEANILEVSSAYSAFSNGGFLITPRCISSIKTAEGELIYGSDPVIPDRIISERTSLLMRAMLQKAIREGTGTSLGNIYGIDIPLAGKTGTSQNYADAWFAVFNPRLVIVARAGASTPAIHFNNGAFGSGSALALPLVALTLKKIRNDRTLNERFIASFPDLPPDLEHTLDCPDFRDKDFFDIFIDIFEPRKRTYERRGEEIERRIRSVLRKIFKNKKNN